MENKPKKNILNKGLSDGPSGNLRPLINRNVEKVYIVKWSQDLISTARSSISGIPRIVKKNIRFLMHFFLMAEPESGLLAIKSKLETTLKNILLPHYYYKV